MEIYNQAQWGLSCNVDTLPMDGSTVYARLFTYFADGWQHNDYTFTAASQQGAGVKFIEPPVKGASVIRLTTPAE